ncbi:biotin/lipoyl-binding protein, partial [Pseudomonas otitidis]
MTPDQRFARRVRAAIVAFVLLFAYFLAADLWMPVTPQAQLTRPVVRLAPRVGGQVLDVAVANNRHVEAGQVLFRLDPEPYRLAVAAAELAVEAAARDNAELDAGLAAARASLHAAEVIARELPDSQRIAQSLGQMYSVLCASPDYLARHGVPSG